MKKYDVSIYILVQFRPTDITTRHSQLIVCISKWRNASILEYVLLTLNKSTHSECTFANDANNVMIFGMEADFRDVSSGVGHCLGRGDHFPLLPEEVDQLEVWAASLGQQVLRVVRKR